MYQTLKCKITGVSPLLMHNPQLANPINPIVRKIKEITAKGKKKTDSDLEELARLEFVGGLYVDGDKHPVIPGEMIEGMIRDGAKKSRRGKDVQCGIISDGLWKLIYTGPKDPDAMWEDERFRDFRGVKVGKARVMRMRPRFDEWSLAFDIAYNPDVANKADINKWLEDGGSLCGIGDYHPRFGRFVVDSVT